MVTVRVSDILYYWSQHKNLDILKEMDKRYQDSNILGNCFFYHLTKSLRNLKI